MTVNKNTVPNEQRSPFVTSGLRLGTPAMTTRGFGLAEAKQVAQWICDVLDDMETKSTLEAIRKQVLALCAKFPVYPN